MPENELQIELDLANYQPQIDLQDLFREKVPVHIEVGAGKGTFLLNQAKLHPEINYLGIEWAAPIYRYCLDRMERWKMTNVRMMRTDARDFIGRYVKDKSVNTYHVYFPDPWPKARHHKRRFFAPDNILQVIRTLEIGGQLRVATDHAEYFEVIAEVLLEDPDVSPLLKQVNFLPTDAADEGEWVGSNFERKYIKEGRKTYSLALEKHVECDVKHVVSDRTIYGRCPTTTHSTDVQ